jgi:hypothetical protein
MFSPDRVAGTNKKNVGEKEVVEKESGENLVP